MADADADGDVDAVADAPVEVSISSLVEGTSDQPEVEQQIPNSIYRIGRSDLFACKNCKVKGDKPFMLKHPQYCKAGNHSKQNSGDGKKVK